MKKRSKVLLTGAAVGEAIDAGRACVIRSAEDIQLDRVGAFAFSPQEGTAAHALPDDVPESVKLERLDRLNELRRSGTTMLFISVCCSRALNVSSIVFGICIQVSPFEGFERSILACA